jgi:hypothetical protein
MNRFRLFSIIFILSFFSVHTFAMHGALLQAGDKVYTPWLRKLDNSLELEASISHIVRDEEFILTISLTESEAEKTRKKELMESMGIRNYKPSSSEWTLTRNLKKDDIEAFIIELTKRDTANAKKIVDYLNAL